MALPDGTRSLYALGRAEDRSKALLVAERQSSGSSRTVLCVTSQAYRQPGDACQHLLKSR